MDPNIIDYYIINCALPSTITIKNRFHIDFGKPAGHRLFLEALTTLFPFLLKLVLNHRPPSAPVLQRFSFSNVENTIKLMEN